MHEEITDSYLYTLFFSCYILYFGYVGTTSDFESDVTFHFSSDCRVSLTLEQFLNLLVYSGAQVLQ